MTDPLFEPRSFQGLTGDGPRLDGWAEEPETWDEVRSSALIHRVRWHTGLTQAEFAAAYGFDPEHLSALEKGRLQPNAALVSYLTVIDRAPDLVRAALATC